MQFSKHWAATLDDYAIDLAWSPDGALLAAANEPDIAKRFQRMEKLLDLPAFLGHARGVVDEEAGVAGAGLLSGRLITRASSASNISSARPSRP